MSGAGPCEHRYMTDTEVEHERGLLTAALSVDPADLLGWLAARLVDACDEISRRDAARRKAHPEASRR